MMGRKVPRVTLVHKVLPAQLVTLVQQVILVLKARKATLV
jgi:hypothetical protein